eukprot:scaffold109207_cov34-Tisochrysis_lutea.AAC.2
MIKWTKVRTSALKPNTHMLQSLFPQRCSESPVWRLEDLLYATRMWGGIVETQSLSCAVRNWPYKATKCGMNMNGNE